jgi:hypothetical protein
VTAPQATPFEPGSLVDITIRGARVSESHFQERHLHLFAPDTPDDLGPVSHHLFLPLPLASSVTVTPVVDAKAVHTDVATLRVAIALLLEFATERDAATAGLLTVIADDAEDNPTLPLDMLAPALRLAELIVGGE